MSYCSYVVSYAIYWAGGSVLGHECLEPVKMAALGKGFALWPLSCPLAEEGQFPRV